MEITRTYRPEDQAMIDEVTSDLRDYEETLLKKVNAMDCEDMDRDMAYRNDPFRNMLIDKILELHSIIMPITTITMSSEEFEESSFSKEITR